MLIVSLCWSALRRICLSGDSTTWMMCEGRLSYIYKIMTNQCRSAVDYNSIAQRWLEDNYLLGCQWRRQIAPYEFRNPPWMWFLKRLWLISLTATGRYLSDHIYGMSTRQDRCGKSGSHESIGVDSARLCRRNSFFQSSSLWVEFDCDWLEWA